MPFYEYKCTHCEAETEVLQKISEEPIVKCESCGNDTLERVISAPGLQFKGDGWCPARSKG